MTSTVIDVDATTDIGRKAIREYIKEWADDRAHDPYGSGMNALGVIVDTLWECGEGVPGAIATQGMGGGVPDIEDTEIEDEFSDARELYAAIERDVLSVDDVRYGMFVLDRYLDIVNLAGRSY